MLSASTILILSGFLIGLTTSSGLTGEMQRLVFFAGLVGVLAFIGLDHVAERRRLRQEAKEQQLIEDRLARHVNRCDTLRDPADTDTWRPMSSIAADQECREAETALV